MLQRIASKLALLILYTILTCMMMVIAFCLLAGFLIVGGAIV